MIQQSNYMKRISTALLLFVTLLVSSVAQAQKPDRDDFREKIREYKHNYLKAKLDLSREQASQFFEEYDQMDDAITALNDEARAVEKKIYDSPNGTVTEMEYEMATNILLEVKAKEAAIESEYYAKFKEILSPKQLFELRKVERDFTMQLVKFRNRSDKKK